MDRAIFFKEFESLADTPDAVTKLRELVLELAINGKLSRLGNQNEKTPVDWERKLLGDVASVITKGATPTSYGFAYEPSGIRFVKVENVEDGRIQNTAISQFISPEAHEFLKRSQLEENDVLFSIAGTIGETCVVRTNDLPANTNQAFAIIRGTSQDFVPDFLKLQLDSFVSRQVKEKARGGAMPNVSLGDLRVLEVVIPPLAEQKRIVAKVEELMGLCDELAARQQTQREARARLTQSAFTHLTAAQDEKAFRHHAGFLLQHSAIAFDDVAQLRQSILQLAVQGRLVPQDPKDEPASLLLAKIRETSSARFERGEIRKRKPRNTAISTECSGPIPSGWAPVTLGEIADVNWGNTSLTKAAYSDSGYPAYSATGPDGFVRHAEFDAPGIVLSAIGARSGKCFLAEGKWTAIKNTITIIPFDPVSNEWLFRVINRESAWEKRGGAQPFIALTDAVSLPILLPPLAEQKRIVAKVGEMLRLCDELESRLAQSRTLGEQLLAATIHRLLEK